jgi:hypothetical protein
MKPTFQTNDDKTREGARKFPITDCNYHSVALGCYRGHCAKTVSPSFHSLSRDYFKTEARQYFLAETIVFAAIMATAVLPIVNGAEAVIDLVRTIGGI